MVKFGDVVKNVNLVERDPKANGIDRVVGLEHLDPENLHIRRWNSVEDSSSFTRKFLPGQTLFGKRRAYQRKVAYAEFEGICSGDILTFESRNKNVLLPELLPFICQSEAFFDYALGTSAGSLSPRTSWTALRDFEFPLPPLDEQKRIAEILWATDEVVEQFVNASEKLKQTRETYLRCLTSNGATKKWEVTKLSECFEIVSGQVNPKEEPYCSMLLIAPNHIEQNTGRLICIETAKDQNAISGKYLFQAGDVVYSKIRPNLRKAFIAEFDGLCSADMYALRTLPNRIMTRFLLSILLSEHFTSFALTRCVRTGIPKLNRQELSEYELPIPSIKEQKRISFHLESIGIQEQNLIRHRNEVVELKRQFCREHLDIDHV
jgi:type I restriction enzyme S subunit